MWLIQYSGLKPEIPISQLPSEIETKFQRLNLHFRGPAIEWPRMTLLSSYCRKNYLCWAQLERAELNYPNSFYQGSVLNTSQILHSPVRRYWYHTRHTKIVLWFYCQLCVVNRKWTQRMRTASPSRNSITTQRKELSTVLIKRSVTTAALEKLIADKCDCFILSLILHVSTLQSNFECQTMSGKKTMANDTISVAYFYCN